MAIDPPPAIAGDKRAPAHRRCRPERTHTKPSEGVIYEGVKVFLLLLQLLLLLILYCAISAGCLDVLTWLIFSSRIQCPYLDNVGNTSFPRSSPAPPSSPCGSEY